MEVDAQKSLGRRTTGVSLPMAILPMPRPEWVGIVFAAAAWGALVPHVFGDAALDCGSYTFLDEWRVWSLMVAAMMLPRAFADARWCLRVHPAPPLRATLMFFLGFIGPWLLIGVPVAALMALPPARSGWSPVFAFLLAGAWSLMPARSHVVHPTAPPISILHPGWRADWALLRLGVLRCGPCVANCGFLMVGCALAGHGVVAMAGGLVPLGVERLGADRRWATAAAVLLGGWYAGVALRG